MKNQTAQQAYDQKMTEIEMMIARLNEMKALTRKAHWGDVGTISLATSELATACRTLEVITTKEAISFGAEY